MNPLYKQAIITLSLLVGLIILSILMHIGKSDKKSIVVTILHRLVFVAFGASLFLTGYKAKLYYDYGAFYDDSYTKADVENHLGYFKSEDTEFLQSVYDKDPENFDFDAYPVIIIRYGCKDCEDDYDLVMANDERFYIIFSRSDIGKRYVEKYGVIRVPCFIKNGQILNYAMYQSPDIVFPDGY